MLSTTTNVKCRLEMFDKDLMMLQVGASMMDPNHFLMIVLSLFELFHIVSSADCRKRYNIENTDKDVVQQNSTLIEEMLHLIIMVVGERFTPGIGHVEDCDELNREIIHRLCIRPMAHSELVKALPENVSRRTHGIVQLVMDFLCAAVQLYYIISKAFL
ncbi:E3 ubiquitin-protein ligase UBR2-like [Ictalurus furcatus]|uniref:E3 ubiquitin-protein ligase UBR2-like n=1 Tax=Ictalurus furcatus TaxID=66913 RepID=UPI002350A2DE|nr:E3 ubiquitin-protein ligase UBR2-like [Ictalurus furcatus]